MKALLETRDLEWRAAGQPVIEHVSFAVAPGEFIALMGRNGAGKSTLLDLIAGLRRAFSGVVELDGKPLGAWTAVERARRVGHLPQAVRADLPFSVEQLVLMGRYPHADRWFESDADRAVVERAMTRCDCLPFRGRRAATLSGGERQRVLLAACLAQAPRLLLLDEPATFLDVDQQLHCFSLLREEAAAGIACVAVTHDVNLALTFCSRIIVLAGRTIAHDTPAATALERLEWLELFSSRLEVTETRAGRPWVCFQ